MSKILAPLQCFSHGSAGLMLLSKIFAMVTGQYGHNKYVIQNVIFRHPKSQISFKIQNFRSNFVQPLEDI